MKMALYSVGLLFALCGTSAAQSAAQLEQQFRSLPVEARRLTGPLFWLHGDESRERLEGYLEKVAQGGNGCFTAESRPHRDWLGPNWYRDLGICLDAARRLNLKMWIFDERWWPSGEVGGYVPQQYASKCLDASATDVAGPRRYEQQRLGPHLVAVLAGRVTDAGIDGRSLQDLTGQVTGGTLRWDAPPGRWQVLVFTWCYSSGRRGRLLVDGASRDAVDWYIRTVYQPHYDHFAAEFGRTIVGYFYDEPETWGDWGTEVLPLLNSRGVDWRQALVAWKFRLAGETQVAAKYQYQDALAEAWGRTLYGGLTAWCHAHRVESIGHFLEHGGDYLNPKLCAGNMIQLQKYSDMGAIDAVFRQFVPGQKDDTTYQTPKLGSSISHVYGKRDDVAMVEIFGARGQDLTYPEMKWWTDHMHVSGINFHIPHSFNPRAPFDRDCPPYFYNGGYEPRWPLYRVYADYTSRLSLMLTGGRHVCPVALLFLGNSAHVGQATRPEVLTTALQDALFDCDWIPYDVFEQTVAPAGHELRLRDERYRLLVVPAVEVIPYATLAKVRAYFDAGGLVVGYGRLPELSATLGKTSADIAALRQAIWGTPAAPGLKPCRVNAVGGRAYFLPEKPTVAELQQVLTGDAGVHPTLEVLAGDTGAWLHVLHRVKAGRDVFLICNQHHEGAARRFTFRAHAPGVPECWDALRGAINSLPWRRAAAGSVDFELTLEPLESVLVVFQNAARELPSRPTAALLAGGETVAVTREPAPVERLPDPRQQVHSVADALQGCAWMWAAADASAMSVPPCTRYFRRAVELPAGRRVRKAQMVLTADNSFVLYVNGRERGTGDNWSYPVVCDLSAALVPGVNTLAIAATNGGEGPNAAGLIGRLRVEFDAGTPLVLPIDSSWKTHSQETPGWAKANFDDHAWAPARLVAPLGRGPWRRMNEPLVTLSPVQADPFLGRFTLPPSACAPRVRVYAVMDGIEPEDAAAVRVNGQHAGGFIGRPFRLDITPHVHAGVNRLEIRPFAPRTLRVAVVPQ